MNHKIFKIFSFSFICSLNFSTAQTFLNGSFEVNTAGSDQINLTNPGFNAIMANSIGFGSYGDIDVVTSASWGGSGAQQGSWYSAITGGGTDAISLRLSAPLVAGTVYTIRFYDRCDGGWVGTNIQIGQSTTNNTFGTLIYACPAAPVTNVWTLRQFTFTAPNNGQFITVSSLGALQNWNHVDNFAFVVPLPIELISFEADCENNNVILNWNTASELNNDCFIIERSENGVDFYSIGKIAASKMANANIRYTFTDSKALKGLTYYRLKQIDHDKSEYFSDNIAINSCETLSANALEIFPNPVNSIANIRGFFDKESEITVLNSLGEIVLNQKSESFEMQLDLSGLPPGIYLINFTKSGSHFSKRIIKE